ncbi:MAG: glutaminyl-peptide cyclotransferase [Chloroflexi bacterium]|nr:glutaminyl-peptide cyclotransferase [Chloroflexota bacterium]
MKLNLRFAVLVLLALTAVILSACTKSQTPPTPLPSAANVLGVPLAVTAAPTESYPVVIAPAAAAAAYPGPENQTPIHTYRIVNTYPHDPNAFTQGLVWYNGRLLEGTGLNNQYLAQRNLTAGSSIRRVNLETGEVEQIVPLDDPYFGEGIVVWEDNLIQLTWQDHVAFVYDKETFAQLEQFSYQTEGWGVTHDGRQLIMSDGSSYLTFRDPQTFAQTGQIQVLDKGTPVQRLNELEYINGEVWANVWQTNRIARIDPHTGRVNSWLDLSGILDGIEISQQIDVLNGIAYDATNDRIFVTGKLWPVLFEVEIEQ